LSFFQRFFGTLGGVLNLCCCSICISGKFTLSVVCDRSRVGKVNECFQGFLCCLVGFLLFFGQFFSGVGG
jgi:hypothetical protein